MKYVNELNTLADIANTINRAEKESSFVDKCQKIFGALESIFNRYIEYAQAKNLLSERAKVILSNIQNRNDRNLRKPELSIIQKFIETIRENFSRSEKENLIESKEFKAIIHFYPLIMDDNILGRNRCNPSNIEPEIRKESSKRHQKLIDDYNNRMPSNRLIDDLCTLLYLVRCNLQHEGKTPEGPDKEKNKRDEGVCKLIYPTLLYIIDILLEKPSKKLLLYGTLKNNEPNAALIDNYRKNPKNVFVWGFIENENDLPYYTFDISNIQPTVEAELLCNNDLQNCFEKLDQFEGETYQRIKVPYKDGDEIGIANIYEKNYN